MKRFSLVSFVVIALVIALAIAVPAIAHERREVGEARLRLSSNIGWRVEPAYTNLFNRPELRQNEQPIEGLETSYGGHATARGDGRIGTL